MSAPVVPTTLLRVLLAGADRSVAWRFAGAVLLVIIGAVIAGLAPVALKAMVDAMGRTASDSRDAAIGWSAVYLLALCGGRILADLRPAVAGVAEQRLYAHLRRRFHAHLLDLPLQFHLGSRSGEMAQCLPQAIAGYQLVVFHLINGVAPAMVEMGTVVIVLVSLAQAPLTAIFVIGAIAHLIILARGRHELTKAARAVSAASLEVQGRLAEMLLNVETIKCFDAEGSMADRYARATDELERCWVALQRQRLRTGLAITAIFGLSMATSIAIAIHAVSRGTLSVGGFVLANIYLLQIVRPLEMLGAASRDIAQASAFIRPLLKVLDEPTATASSDRTPQTRVDAQSAGASDERCATTASRPSDTPLLSLRSLHLDYGAGSPVLSDVSLDIAAGSTVALVGASGSGKTSLVRLLLRLHEPQRGSILLRNVAIDRMAVQQLRAMMGIVPQDTVLFNDSLWANIGIARPNATRQQIEHAARGAQLHDFIMALPDGYDTVVGERGLKLSGGERQRVAIARVVLKDPPICVFDEATSMLDSVTETTILERLRAISAGRTTITIAHRLRTIQHADQIVVLDRGSVVERGRHADLLARDGIYAAMWHAQR